MSLPLPVWDGHRIDRGVAGNGWAQVHCVCHNTWHVTARPVPKPRPAAGEGTTP